MPSATGGTKSGRGPSAPQTIVLRVVLGPAYRRRTHHDDADEAGKLRAGTGTEFEQASQATVVGKEVPGLRERWLAQDTTDPDGGFAVSVWETREALQAYEQNAVFTQDLLLYGFGQIIVQIPRIGS